MGESLLEIPEVDYKMGESITNVPCLEQSVSFGRFERDSLCWERWSTFPTNKYLEEVEKCSTPGSVAQKKAYFEAHYKQIAARRAELQREAELARFVAAADLLMMSAASRLCSDLFPDDAAADGGCAEFLLRPETCCSRITVIHAWESSCCRPAATVCSDLFPAGAAANGGCCLFV